jgi:hypothetical protein
MPVAAAGQTFGQLLDSEIPLETIRAPAQGVRDRPRPELQPAPLRIAGLAVSASLDATLGTTSNALGAQSQRRADSFAGWRPQINAALDLGPDRAARIMLDYDGKRFLATPAKRQDGHYIGVSGNYALGLGGMLFASAFQQRIYEDQLAGSFPANGGGAVAIDQSHAQARLAQAFNRVKLTGALTFDRLLYHDTLTTTGVLLPQSWRDDRVLRASVRIDYTLLANTALFAQGSRRDTDFAADPRHADRSSDEWQAIGGISTDVNGLFRLSAGIGGYWRQYRAPLAGVPAKAPAADKLAGLAGDLRGVWYLTALTTVSLQARREFVDADINLSPGYDATSLRLQLDHEFLRTCCCRRRSGTKAIVSGWRRAGITSTIIRSGRIIGCHRICWSSRASNGSIAPAPAPRLVRTSPKYARNWRFRCAIERGIPVFERALVRHRREAWGQAKKWPLEANSISNRRHLSPNRANWPLFFWQCGGISGSVLRSSWAALRSLRCCRWCCPNPILRMPPCLTIRKPR